MRRHFAEEDTLDMSCRSSRYTIPERTDADQTGGKKLDSEFGIYHYR